MANTPISGFLTKNTFGDSDFLGGTQGSAEGDNRKYGKAALKNSVAMPIRYRARLTFSSSGVVVSILVLNEFSESIAWSRNGAGEFAGQLPAGTTTSKVAVQVTQHWGGDAAVRPIVFIEATPASTFAPFVLIRGYDETSTPVDDFRVNVNIDLYP